METGARSRKQSLAQSKMETWVKKCRETYDQKREKEKLRARYWHQSSPGSWTEKKAWIIVFYDAKVKTRYFDKRPLYWIYREHFAAHECVYLYYISSSFITSKLRRVMISSSSWLTKTAAGLSPSLLSWTTQILSSTSSTSPGRIHTHTHTHTHTQMWERTKQK